MAHLLTNRYASKLHNTRVLLIGGTGDIGIGLAAALLEFGASSITLSSSRRSSIDAVLSSIRTAYPDADPSRLKGYMCDLSSPQIEANLEKLFKQTGPVEHVVFLAGERLPTVPLEQLSLALM